MGRESILKTVIGAVMVIFGLLIIFVPSFGLNLWLLFIWLPAIFMEYKAFVSEDKGLFVPGGILSMVSLILTLNVIFPAFISNGGWALFIMAPAIGLFQLYAGTTPRNSALLVAPSILTAVSVFFVLLTNMPSILGIFVGIALFVVGGIIIYTNLRTSLKR